MVGGVDKKNRPENNFTEAQFKSLSRLLRFYKAKYPKVVIVGHNELDHGKACPSFDVQAWLLKQRIQC
jgi:N-acetyl-anhydromuramyl-L-alanine amidase AmpD